MDVGETGLKVVSFFPDGNCTHSNYLGSTFHGTYLITGNILLISWSKINVGIDKLVDMISIWQKIQEGYSNTNYYLDEMTNTYTFLNMKKMVYVSQ